MAKMDPQSPWLGLDSFSEETRGFFHGRDEEIAELGRRVRRKLLTVLFGQSGLGKTSILRAGVVPRLREEAYCPVYIRIDYGPAAPLPARQVCMAIEAVARLDGEPLPADESLWALLHLRDATFTGSDGKPVIPLLIFDQFEEMFTLGQADGGARARTAGFVEELACLVENRPPRALEESMDSDDSLVERYDFAREDVRVLISLREDYLAHLEQLKTVMPGITQNRMRLAPMTGAQALEAVRIPGGALVGEEVALAIVRFVAGAGPDADIRQVPVEPALLSLICRELNDARIRAGRTEITFDLLAGSHASILSDFYERAMAPHPPAVRAIVEDLLLTDSGHRENVALERIEQLLDAAGAGLNPLADLVNRRLLRIEERLNLRRVELTHDVLCAVVRASRDLRQEREARLVNERRLHEQKERELATRRSLVRTRQVAAGSAVLALGAMVALGVAWYAHRNAAQAEQRADTARRTSAIARSQAERLIGYLNHDFARQLEPLARQDLVENLNRRTVGYYRSLPSIEPGTETELNQATALVRYGVALRKTARIEDAAAVLTQATGIIEARRARGDRSEATTVALAEAYLAQRRLAFARQDMVMALEKSTSAMRVLQALARRPGATVAIRRLYAEILHSKAGVERTVDQQAAIKSSDEAERMYRTLYPEGPAHPDAAVEIALGAADTLYIRLLAGQRNLDAYADSAEQAARLVMARDPANLSARKALAFLLSQRANVALEQQAHLRAVGYFDAARVEFAQLLRLDPMNENNRVNLVNTVLRPMGLSYVNQGYPDKALAIWRDALAQAGNDETSGATKAYLFMSTSVLQAQIGDPAAGGSLQDADTLIKTHLKKYPSQAAKLDLANCFLQSAHAGLLTVRGDFAGAKDVLESYDIRRIAGRGIDPVFERTCAEYLNQQAAEIHLAAKRGKEAAALLARFDAPLVAQPAPGDTDLRRARMLLLALAHAESGRHAEAAGLVKVLLPEQRVLVALKGGNRMLEVELAALLLLQARSAPAQAGAGARAEARALLAALPPAMKRMYDVRRWQNLADKPGGAPVREEGKP